ncbi:MAG: aldo/keto reductase [Clostridia bacterium]
MKYRKYTKYSTDVSEIGFGAWQLGNVEEWGKMSDREAVNLVHKALDEGVNFFDTAPNYANGNSERLLGEALSHTDRGKVVISTKFGHWADGHTDFSAKAIRESVNQSLKRLKTDYVDSVLLHNPGTDMLDRNKCEHYEILEGLKDEGKILAYGASLDKAYEITSFLNNTGGEVIEAFFNIFHQDSRFAFDLAGEKETAVIVKIPLDSGWLTGKYTKGSSFGGIRSRWSEKDIHDRAALLDLIGKYPEKGQSLAQFAIGFCLSYDAVSTVIPGVRNIEQLEMNIKSSMYDIPGRVIAELEELFEMTIRPMNLPW